MSTSHEQHVIPARLLHTLNEGIEHMSLLVEVHKDSHMTDIMDL